MKKIALFSFFAAAWFQVSAQQNVTITGRVSNAESDSVLLAIPENVFDSKEHATYAVLNSNKEFTITLPLKHPVLADLATGDDVITLYLQPGDNMEVKFSADDIVNSIKFKGQGEAENVYLREFSRKFEENEDYQVLPDNINSREAQFKNFINARKEDQLNFLKKYIAKSPLSEEFQKLAKANIEFTSANDLLTYVDLREQVVNGEKRLTVFPTFYDFLKDIDLNNPAAFISPVYNEFALNYAEFMAQEANVKKTDQEYYYTCFQLAKNKFSGAALNQLQARIIYNSCKTGHLGFTDRMLNDFNKTAQDTKLAAILNQAYLANKTFAMGAPAPDFTLTTVDGKTVRLSDFKGKLVYLSFWQTDCGLCLMDMPYAQELAKTMSDKAIVFLNINMDKDEKAWRNMVTKKNLLGVHVYGKTPGTDLTTLYALKETPSYFLIAEDGTFLSTKPKRPSSHGATDEIAKAFGKAANVASALKK
jgi:thiol-disulfide isomerase/thioredoxin